MNKTFDKKKLIEEYIVMRGYYFNRCGEKLDKFNDKYENHHLKDIVLQDINTSFRDIFQTAEKAIENYLSK